MQAKRGIAWLVAALVLSVILTFPGALRAADFRLPLLPIEARNSLETQMLGEQPLPPSSTQIPSLKPGPSLNLHPEGADARLKLPFKTELNISIRYNRDPASKETSQLSSSTPLYMKYAMDYRVLPNLRVGLNSYLYRPAEEGFKFESSQTKNLLGVGPELKYDLGRWSFLVKSQLETGNREQPQDLQNWFRVWYAF
jgi:hypothetical protein